MASRGVSPATSSKFTEVRTVCPITPILPRFIHFKQNERDYYAVLGVSKTATAAQIKEAFYKKTKELHPDSCRSENATAQFMELKNAYDVLRRPADRSSYDNRGRRDYHNMYRNTSYSYSHGPHYDHSDDWRRFWRETERANYSASENKKKSERQWKVILMWTAFGTLLIVLYNLGYVLQIYFREYQLSKLLDEDEITKSFLRQSEFRDKDYDEHERISLAKMLKADVDEAWRRRQEEFRGRNRNEIREEYRWLKAVQDADHHRKIKAQRAEQRRRETEIRWGRLPREPPPGAPSLD